MGLARPSLRERHMSPSRRPAAFLVLLLSLVSSAAHADKPFETARKTWRNQYGWGGSRVVTKDGAIVEQTTWRGRKDSSGARLASLKRVTTYPQQGRRDSSWTLHGGKQLVRTESFREADGTRGWRRTTALSSDLSRVTSKADRPGDPMRMEVATGMSIPSAIGLLAELAQRKSRPVAAKMNGAEVVIRPGEPAALVHARWQQAYDAQYQR